VTKQDKLMCHAVGAEVLRAMINHLRILKKKTVVFNQCNGCCCKQSAIC